MIHPETVRTVELEFPSLREHANAAFRERYYDLAKDLYTKALEDEDIAALYNNRAACHLKLKEYSAAVDDTGRAIDLEPSLWKAYVRRGDAYLKLGRKEDARMDYAKVVDAAEDDRLVLVANKGLLKCGPPPAVGPTEVKEEVQVDTKEVKVDTKEVKVDAKKVDSVQRELTTLEVKDNVKKTLTRPKSAVETEMYFREVGDVDLWEFVASLSASEFKGLVEPVLEAEVLDRLLRSGENRPVEERAVVAQSLRTMRRLGTVRLMVTEKPKLAALLSLV